MLAGDSITELPLIGTLDLIIEEKSQLLYVAPYCDYYTGLYKVLYRTFSSGLSMLHGQIGV